MKVREERRSLIPKRAGWHEVRSKHTHTKDGKLTEKVHAFIEMTSHKQVKWFTSVNNINIGQIFGGIGDGKREKSVF